MFYNFSAPRAITKRRRVNRACSHCRVQRIRCDTNTPCSQCVDQGILCSRLSVSDSSNRRELRKNEQPPRPVRRKSPNTGIQDTNRNHAEISTQQPGESGYQLDSTLDFVTRINTFCSQVLQSSSWTGSHEDDPGPYRSPFCPGEVDVSSAQCDISTSQLKSLFWVFQTRIHPQIPIISQEDLQISTSSNEAETPTTTPLQDAIIAYTMQYIFHSGLHTRLLGLQWKQFDAGKHRSRVVGMPYFQRCWSYCSQQAIFTTPSLMALKCFCILTLFLLDTGQHHTAYTVIGMAVRVARFMNLDKIVPSASHDETESLQIWWTLIHLDFRCSRYAGHSTSEIFTVAVSTPYHPPDNVIHAKSSPYYIQCLRLTCAALSIIRTLPQRRISETNSDIQARVQNLASEFQPIEDWKKEIQRNKTFKYLSLDIPHNIMLPDIEPNSSITNHDVNIPFSSHPLEVQLNTLLALQYHDILISLYRSFIRLTAEQEHDPGTSHSEAAQTALKHALTTVHIIHSRMSQHDVFYGCSELYQYQWNAVLTLIGFMLAYPSSVFCSAALKHVNLALEVFEFGGRMSDAAARAAGFTRFLRDRVYKMGVSSTSIPVSLADKSLEQASPGEWEFAASPIGLADESLRQLREGTLGSGSELALWSWSDIVDPSLWSASVEGNF